MMSFESIVENIEVAVGKSTIDSVDETGKCLHLGSDTAIRVFKHLANEPEIRMNFLVDMFAVDEGTGFQVVCKLLSTEHGHEICVKMLVSAKKPELISLSSIWAAAVNFEREIHEMFGIEILGNQKSNEPLLLPADWAGHPMQKNYSYPETYGGIEHRREAVTKEYQRQ